jgi:hypothetical protein
MRSRYILLAAALSVGAVSIAWAADDPVPSAPAQQTAPASTPATPAAAASSSSDAAAKAPAKAAASAANSKDADADVQEKHLLARGYKKETHNGQTVYCRKEIKLGSRFETKQCGTAQDMELAEQQARDLINTTKVSGGSRTN